eukprot:TRINITY_DN37173_c0_g1_i1.p1 TRINITY_DN37173_c0_g1~~TRINITY_DN37173_c0_g1_i1.p1  ORF type:complete len:645 (+),score=139.11 TRINITY_DN37173_c0_g1_i1:136-2070(+)
MKLLVAPCTFASLLAFVLVHEVAALHGSSSSNRGDVSGMVEQSAAMTRASQMHSKKVNIVSAMNSLAGMILTRDSPGWTASKGRVHRVHRMDWNGEGPVDPAFVALPRNADDVMRVLAVAFKQNVTVSVKGGGHSFGGYSTISDKKGFMMNMAKMNHIGKVKTKCKAARKGKDKECSSTVTVGGGANWKQIYSRLKEMGGWLLAGGECPWVGAAGFVLGGGASPMSRLKGLGADNVLNFTVVTPDGRLVVANEKQNKDLFWALRGGGGGNFGIVVDLTLRVWRPSTVAATGKDGSPRFSYGFICYKLKDAPTVLAAVNDHYSKVDRHVNVNLKMIRGKGICLSVTAIASLKNAIKLLAPITKAVAAAGAKTTSDSFKAGKHEFKYYWDMARARDEEVDGIMFDKKHYDSSNCLIKSIPPALAQRILTLKSQAPKTCPYFVFVSLGGKVEEVEEDATAFPWRKSMYMMYVGCEYGDEHLLEDKAASWTFLQKWYKTVEPFCTGSFVNFLDPIWAGRPDVYQPRYYGPNLERLQAIKARYFNPSRHNPLHFPMEIVVPSGIMRTENKRRVLKKKVAKLRDLQSMYTKAVARSNARARSKAKKTHAAAQKRKKKRLTCKSPKVNLQALPQEEEEEDPSITPRHDTGR